MDMSKAKFITLVLILLLIVGGVFYWFQYRPSEIRKKCIAIAKEGKNLSGVFEKYDLYTSRGFEQANRDYSDCLVGEGLKPEKLYNP